MGRQEGKKEQPWLTHADLKQLGEIKKDYTKRHRRKLVWHELQRERQPNKNNNNKTIFIAIKNEC